MNAETKTNARRTYLKLLHSSLFKTYAEAFEEATGLPLLLRFSGDADHDNRDDELYHRESALYQHVPKS